MDIQERRNQMNDGVAMLLERMKTNPEEFVAEVQYGTTKWNNLLAEHRPYLDKEDLEAFDKAHEETVFKYMQQRFTEKVMEELIDPRKLTTEDLIKQYRDPRLTSYTGSVTLNSGGAGTNTGAVTLNANSMTLGNTTIDETTLQHMKAHVEALKKQRSTPIAGVTQTV